MLVFPEFYKVGVSISGDHDARLDKAWWNELYQGYPVQDDYAAQSNVTMARRLQGHLLLEHGDIDENVHPVETMRFVDALMKANKNFDMLFVPNMFHGESGEHNLYLVRRRWDYFVQHLLGVTPPANFEIKEDREPGSKRAASTLRVISVPSQKLRFLRCRWTDEISCRGSRHRPPVSKF